MDFALHHLRENRSDGAEIDDPRPDTDRARTPRRDTFLACAGCRAHITTASARREIGGSHIHTFTNPHGIRFRIGCFAAATAQPCGEATTYWTWFPGYAWQVENCPSCREHLGWMFRASEDLFHGLVLDRLIEVDES